MFCIKCGIEMQTKNCVCGYEHFENALSVAIALVTIIKDDKPYLLGVKRNIPPFVDGIALPGGFQEIENVTHTALRELREETGIVLPEEPTSFDDKVYLKTTPDGRRNLIFLKYQKPLNFEDIDWSFTSSETKGLVLIDKNTEICFSLHKEVIDLVLV